MGDLIDRQMAIDEIRKDVMGGLNYESILKRLPSADSKIIKCKDCKFKNYYLFPPKYDKKCYCENHGKIITEIDYCSWAERRADVTTN